MDNHPSNQQYTDKTRRNTYLSSQTHSLSQLIPPNSTLDNFQKVGNLPIGLNQAHSRQNQHQQVKNNDSSLLDQYHDRTDQHNGYNRSQLSAQSTLKIPQDTRQIGNNLPLHLRYPSRQISHSLTSNDAQYYKEKDDDNFSRKNPRQFYGKLYSHSPQHVPLYINRNQLQYQHQHLYFMVNFSTRMSTFLKSGIFPIKTTQSGKPHGSSGSSMEHNGAEREAKGNTSVRRKKSEINVLNKFFSKNTVDIQPSPMNITDNESYEVKNSSDVTNTPKRTSKGNSSSEIEHKSAKKHLRTNSLASPHTPTHQNHPPLTPKSLPKQPKHPKIPITNPDKEFFPKNRLTEKTAPISENFSPLLSFSANTIKFVKLTYLIETPLFTVGGFRINYATNMLEIDVLHHMPRNDVVLKEVFDPDLSSSQQFYTNITPELIEHSSTSQEGEGGMERNGDNIDFQNGEKCGGENGGENGGKNNGYEFNTPAKRTHEGDQPYFTKTVSFLSPFAPKFQPLFNWKNDEEKNEERNVDNFGQAIEPNEDNDYTHIRTSYPFYPSKHSHQKSSTKINNPNSLTKDPKNRPFSTPQHPVSEYHRYPTASTFNTFGSNLDDEKTQFLSQKNIPNSPPKTTTTNSSFSPAISTSTASSNLSGSGANMLFGTAGVFKSLYNNSLKKSIKKFVSSFAERSAEKNDKTVPKQNSKPSSQSPHFLRPLSEHRDPGGYNQFLKVNGPIDSFDPKTDGGKSNLPDSNENPQNKFRNIEKPQSEDEISKNQKKYHQVMTTLFLPFSAISGIDFSISLTSPGEVSIALKSLQQEGDDKNSVETNDRTENSPKKDDQNTNLIDSSQPSLINPNPSTLPEFPPHQHHNTPSSTNPLHIPLQNAQNNFPFFNHIFDPFFLSTLKKRPFFSNYGFHLILIFLSFVSFLLSLPVTGISIIIIVIWLLLRAVVTNKTNFIMLAQYDPYQALLSSSMITMKFSAENLKDLVYLRECIFLPDTAEVLNISKKIDSGEATSGGGFGDGFGGLVGIGKRSFGGVDFGRNGGNSVEKNERNYLELVRVHKSGYFYQKHTGKVVVKVPYDNFLGLVPNIEWNPYSENNSHWEVVNVEENNRVQDDTENEVFDGRNCGPKKMRFFSQHGGLNDDIDSSDVSDLSPIFRPIEYDLGNNTISSNGFTGIGAREMTTNGENVKLNHTSDTSLHNFNSPEIYEDHLQSPDEMMFTPAIINQSLLPSDTGELFTPFYHQTDEANPHLDISDGELEENNQNDRKLHSQNIVDKKTKNTDLVNFTDNTSLVPFIIHNNPHDEINQSSSSGYFECMPPNNQKNDQNDEKTSGQNYHPQHSLLVPIPHEDDHSLIIPTPLPSPTNLPPRKNQSDQANLDQDEIFSKIKTHLENYSNKKNPQKTNHTTSKLTENINPSLQIPNLSSNTSQLTSTITKTLSNNPQKYPNQDPKTKNLKKVERFFRSFLHSVNLSLAPSTSAVNGALGDPGTHTLPEFNRAKSRSVRDVKCLDGHSDENIGLVTNVSNLSNFSDLSKGEKDAKDENGSAESGLHNSTSTLVLTPDMYNTLSTCTSELDRNISDECHSVRDTSQLALSSSSNLTGKTRSEEVEEEKCGDNNEDKNSARKKNRSKSRLKKVTSQRLLPPKSGFLSSKPLGRSQSSTAEHMGEYNGGEKNNENENEKNHLYGGIFPKHENSDNDPPLIISQESPGTEMMIPHNLPSIEEIDAAKVEPKPWVLRTFFLWYNKVFFFNLFLANLYFILFFLKVSIQFIVLPTIMYIYPLFETVESNEEHVRRLQNDFKELNQKHKNNIFILDDKKDRFLDHYQRSHHSITPQTYQSLDMRYIGDFNSDEQVSMIDNGRNDIAETNNDTNLGRFSNFSNPTRKVSFCAKILFLLKQILFIDVSFKAQKSLIIQLRSVYLQSLEVNRPVSIDNVYTSDHFTDDTAVTQTTTTTTTTKIETKIIKKKNHFETDQPHTPNNHPSSPTTSIPSPQSIYHRLIISQARSNASLGLLESILPSSSIISIHSAMKSKLFPLPCVTILNQDDELPSNAKGIFEEGGNDGDYDGGGFGGEAFFGNNAVMNGQSGQFVANKQNTRSDGNILFAGRNSNFQSNNTNSNFHTDNQSEGIYYSPLQDHVLFTPQRVDSANKMSGGHSIDYFVSPNPPRSNYSEKLEHSKNYPNLTRFQSPKKHSPAVPFQTVTKPIQTKPVLKLAHPPSLFKLTSTLPRSLAKGYKEGMNKKRLNHFQNNDQFQNTTQHSDFIISPFNLDETISSSNIAGDASAYMNNALDRPNDVHLRRSSIQKINKNVNHLDAFVHFKNPTNPPDYENDKITQHNETINSDNFDLLGLSLGVEYLTSYSQHRYISVLYVGHSTTSIIDSYDENEHNNHEYYSSRRDFYAKKNQNNFDHTNSKNNLDYFFGDKNNQNFIPTNPSQSQIGAISRKNGDRIDNIYDYRNKGYTYPENDSSLFDKKNKNKIQISKPGFKSGNIQHQYSLSTDIDSHLYVTPSNYIEDSDLFIVDECNDSGNGENSPTIENFPQIIYPLQSISTTDCDNSKLTFGSFNDHGNSPENTGSLLNETNSGLGSLNLHSHFNNSSSDTLFSSSSRDSPIRENKIDQQNLSNFDNHHTSKNHNKINKFPKHEQNNHTSPQYDISSLISPQQSSTPSYLYTPHGFMSLVDNNSEIFTPHSISSLFEGDFSHNGDQEESNGDRIGITKVFSSQKVGFKNGNCPENVPNNNNQNNNNNNNANFSIYPNHHKDGKQNKNLYTKYYPISPPQSANLALKINSTMPTTTYTHLNYSGPSPSSPESLPPKHNSTSPTLQTSLQLRHNFLPPIGSAPTLQHYILPADQLHFPSAPMILDNTYIDNFSYFLLPSFLYNSSTFRYVTKFSLPILYIYQAITTVSSTLFPMLRLAFWTLLPYLIPEFIIVQTICYRIIYPILFALDLLVLPLVPIVLDTILFLFYLPKFIFDFIQVPLSFITSMISITSKWLSLIVQQWLQGILGYRELLQLGEFYKRFVLVHGFLSLLYTSLYTFFKTTCDGIVLVYNGILFIITALINIMTPPALVSFQNLITQTSLFGSQLSNVNAQSTLAMGTTGLSSLTSIANPNTGAGNQTTKALIHGGQGVWSVLTKFLAVRSKMISNQQTMNVDTSLPANSILGGGGGGGIGKVNSNVGKLTPVLAKVDDNGQVIGQGGDDVDHQDLDDLGSDGDYSSDEDGDDNDQNSGEYGMDYDRDDENDNYEWDENDGDVFERLGTERMMMNNGEKTNVVHNYVNSTDRNALSQLERKLAQVSNTNLGEKCDQSELSELSQRK